MQLSIRSILKIFVLLCMLVPASALRAQEITGMSGSSEQDDSRLLNIKKEKAIEADFFTAGMDKLSASFFARLVIDILSLWILVRLIYYPIYHKKDFFFTFFVFNVVIFIITYLLNKVDLSMGAAFGLFAVFSLLRYRTEDISAKDMTYLFVVIALGLISAVNKGTFLETSIINGIILVVAYALDANLFIKNEITRKIQYENIELIKLENRALLLDDLKKRTGLNIHKISIDRIDFLRDTATVIVYFYDTHKNQMTLGSNQ